MKHSLVIVIPIYTSTLTADEERSLKQLQRLCTNETILVVAPEGLTLPHALQGYDSERFSASFFEGIQGYNRLMMSADFYARFCEYEYLLIYQLDAFLFRNDLDAWCKKGYDYIGAPWLVKRKYQGLGRILLWLRSLPRRIQGKPFLPIDFAGKVGNGGFSLRKVTSFAHVCQTQADLMEAWVQKSLTCREYNEDCFWATRPDWTYPSAQEALQFSFDLAPQEAWQRTQGNIPTGCHGWSKPQYRDFWIPIISQYE